MQIQQFLTHIQQWAQAQPDIHGILLVGSHARNAARPDSDIDLVILTTTPDLYLRHQSFANMFGDVVRCEREDWGKVISLRVFYTDGTEVEYGFTTPDWADLPPDPGTQEVITNGATILIDKHNFLSPLIHNYTSRITHYRVREHRHTDLTDYATIPIAFTVRSQMRIEGTELIEEPIEHPYVKDYDAIEGEGPASWGARWDTSHWGILSVYDGDRCVGGAAVAFRTEGMEMLEGRDDCAVLWDIRVHTDYRHRGVGSLLMTHVKAWSRTRNCKLLIVETQNNNVAACNFYAKHGGIVRSVRYGAYEDFPDEIQIWYGFFSGSSEF